MLIFTETCSACPEQYDVTDEQGNAVAYIRLRHGLLTVNCPDPGGFLVYSAYPEGDGCFTTDERKGYLDKCAYFIHQYTVNNLSYSEIPEYRVV